MMSTADATKLRALLAEKFPGLRLRLDAAPPAGGKFHPSGLPQIDQRLRGGFPRGALTEIIAAGQNCGGSTLIRALIQQAAAAGAITALIDGTDAFEATTLDENCLARLLWVRCRATAEAIKAADLVLRDANLPFVLLDLKWNPETQLRKIPAATWYRFQRLLEETEAACIVVTPRPLVAPARARITLAPQFRLAALEQQAGPLLRELKLEISLARKQAELPFPN
jgi:hypothetical protein